MTAVDQDVAVVDLDVLDDVLERLFAARIVLTRVARRSPSEFADSIEQSLVELDPCVRLIGATAFEHRGAATIPGPGSQERSNRGR